MDIGTERSLAAIAPKLLSGELPPVLSRGEQQALRVLEILRDYEWHTAAEMGTALGIGAKYVRDICRICADAWKLESHRRSGWRIADNAPVEGFEGFTPDEIKEAMDTYVGMLLPPGKPDLNNLPDRS